MVLTAKVLMLTCELLTNFTSFYCTDNSYQHYAQTDCELPLGIHNNLGPVSEGILDAAWLEYLWTTNSTKASLSCHRRCHWYSPACGNLDYLIRIMKYSCKAAPHYPAFTEYSPFLTFNPPKQEFNLTAKNWRMPN